MNDASAALDETLRSFAIEPRNPSTREEILRLSRVTGRWEEAIRVQGQLFALAEELPEKLTIARSAAHLVEHEVKDLVRAFRAYLNAFRLAPDDEEIVGHLWRLAAQIGRYEGRAGRQVEEVAAVAGGGGSCREPKRRPTRAAERTRTGPTRGWTTTAVEVDLDEGPRTKTARRAARSLGRGRGDEAAEAAGDDDLMTPRPTTDAPRWASATAARREEDDDAIEVIAEEGCVGEADQRAGSPALARLLALRGPSPSSRRGRSWPPPTRRCPPRTPTSAASTCARSPRSGSAGARRRARAGRARARLPPGHQRRRRARRAGTHRRRSTSEWDRMVAIYIGAIDEFGADRDAPSPCTTTSRASASGSGRPSKAEELYRAILASSPTIRSRSGGSRRSRRSQERWEDLANILDRRTGGATEALPNGPERRARLRELAGALRGPAREAVRGDRHAGALLRESSEEERGDAEPPAAEETLAAYGRWRACTRAWACGPRSSRRCRARPSCERPDRGARAAHRVAARLRKELALPDRAIEAYEAVLAQIARRRPGAGGARSAARGARALRRPAGDPEAARRRWPAATRAHRARAATRAHPAGQPEQPRGGGGRGARARRRGGARRRAAGRHAAQPAAGRARARGGARAAAAHRDREERPGRRRDSARSPS